MTHPTDPAIAQGRALVSAIEGLAAVEPSGWFERFIAGLLDHRPEDRLRTAGRLLRLTEKLSPQRLEAACARALRFDDPAYKTIKHILVQGLEAEELPSIEPPPPALAFVRSATELVDHLMGGTIWK